MSTLKNTDRQNVDRVRTAQASLMTAEELIQLPKGQHRYELLKGELLTMTPSGAEHGSFTINLTRHLANYVANNKLGRVFSSDTGFKLQRNPDTVLAPDISFVSRQRISTLPRGYLDLAPDLVVEVISPSETGPSVEKKCALWLECGVRLVWLVRPKSKTVEVRAANGERRLLTENDELTDNEVVPGFSVQISEIFD
jgi:Uma2 family endonuclease